MSMILEAEQATNQCEAKRGRSRRSRRNLVPKPAYAFHAFRQIGDRRPKGGAFNRFLAVFLTLALFAAVMAIDSYANGLPDQTSTLETIDSPDDTGDDAQTLAVPDAGPIDMSEPTAGDTPWEEPLDDTPEPFTETLGAPNVLPEVEMVTLPTPAAAADLTFAPIARTTAGESLAAAAVGEADFSFSIPGQQLGVPASTVGATTRYDEILPGVDVELANSDNSLKTTYIVKTPEAMGAGLSESITVDPAWTFASTGDGIITISDAQGNKQFDWAGGPVWDANGVTTSVSLHLLEANAGTATVQLAVPQDWLADPARQYPISVDPIIRPRTDNVIAAEIVPNVSAGSMPSEDQPGVADFELRAAGQGNFCLAFQIRVRNGSSWVAYVGSGDDFVLYEDNCFRNLSRGTHSLQPLIAIPPDENKSFENGTQYLVDWRAVWETAEGVFEGAAPRNNDFTQWFNVAEPPTAEGPTAALDGQQDITLTASGSFNRYEWSLAEYDDEATCQDGKLSGSTTSPRKATTLPATGDRFLWCVRGQVRTLDTSNQNAGLNMTAWSPAILLRGDVERNRFFGSDPLFEVHEGVNTASGNWHFSRTDVELNGVADGLAVTRAYNSQNERSGSFGRGFTTAFDTQVVMSENLGITHENRVHCSPGSSCRWVDYRTLSSIQDVVHPDGSRERFRVEIDERKRDNEARWTISRREATPYEGTTKELNWVNNAWQLEAKDGSHFRFNANKWLVEIRQSTGTVLEFTRNSSNRVTRVTDGTSGRKIDFTWRAFGSEARISEAKVTAPNNGTIRKWTYQYAGNGSQLTHACDPREGAFCERYGWTTDGSKINRVYNKAGDLGIEVAYRGDDRVSSIKLRPNGTQVHTTGFTYTEELFQPDATTTVNDGRGKIWKYWFNANGQVTKKDSPNLAAKYTGITTYEYEDGRRTKALVPFQNTDSNASSLVFEYDDNGNLIRENDGGGINTRYHYDSRDRVIAECDHRAGTSRASEHCTTFSYWGATSLVTTRSWYYEAGKQATERWRYNGNGQVIEHTDAEDRTTTYTYLSSASAAGKPGDLRHINYPGGLQHLFEYTNWGQLRKTYERQSTTASWQLLEENVYQNIHGSLWYVYGPVTTNNVTGAKHQVRTRYNYDANLQLAQINVDDREQASVPDQTTNIHYDRLGREVRRVLPTMQLASGASVRPEVTTAYDANGNVSQTCDGRDICTSNTYDSRNQLTQIRRAGVLTNQYWYWDDGNMSQERDGANRLTYYQYNRSGALWLERIRYNGQELAASNVVQFVQFHANTTLPWRVRAGGRFSGGGGSYDRDVRFTYHPNDTVRVQTEHIEGTTNRTTTTLYKKDGQPASITVAGAGGSDRTTFAYDSAGYVRTTTEDAGGLNLVTTTIRDKRGQITDLDDPKGNRTDYRYDLAGNLIHEWAPTSDWVSALSTTVNRGREQTKYGFDAFGNQTEIKRHSTNPISFEYDRFNRLIKTTYPTITDSDGVVHNNSYEAIWYDQNGNIAKQRNRHGGSTTIEVDDLNYPTRVTDPAGKVNTSKFDPVGNMLEHVDGDGRKTTYTYDFFNNPLTETVRLRAFNYATAGNNPATTLQTRFTYDNLGYPATVDTPELPIARTEYDSVGRMVSSTDATDAVTTTTYNFRDQALRTDRPGGFATVAAYDSAGRMSESKELGPNGTQLSKVTYRYDRNGNNTEQTTAAGVKTRYTYDERNRIAETRLTQVSPNVVTTFRYDIRGNQAYIKDGRNKITTVAFNGWDLPITRREPVTATSTTAGQRDFNYRYDDAGNVRKYIMPGSLTIDYDYDNQGRLKEEVGSDSAWREFDYDAIGNTTRVRAAGTPEVQLRYNDANWLMESRQIGVANSATTYAYDGDGRLERRTDPANGGVHTFTWTNRNQIDTHSTNGIVADYDWNAAGNLDLVDFGNGSRRDLVYAGTGRLFHDRWYEGTILRSNRTYTHDADSRVIREQILQRGHGRSDHTYGYDLADRLTTFTIRENVGGWPDNPQTVINYRYDAAGNRTQRITNGATERWTYNNRNQLVTGPGGETFTYTHRGTLSRVVKNGATEQYTFDEFGQMQRYQGPTGTVAYDYDGLGRLEERRQGGTTESFRYTGTARDSSALVGGGTTTLFGRSPSGVLRTYGEAGDVSIAAVDRYGDLMHLANPANGAIIESVVYEPFGDVLNEWGSEDPVLGFQGDYTDPITGEVSADARWYNPGSGTFQSRDAWNGDTSRALSFNRYAYGENNPISFWDPSGLCASNSGSPTPAVGCGSAPRSGGDNRLHNLAADNAPAPRSGGDNRLHNLAETESLRVSAHVAQEHSVVQPLTLSETYDRCQFVCSPQFQLEIAHAIVQTNFQLFDSGRDNNGEYDDNISRGDFEAIRDNTHSNSPEMAQWAALLVLENNAYSVYQTKGSFWDSGWVNFAKSVAVGAGATFLAGALCASGVGCVLVAGAIAGGALNVSAEIILSGGDISFREGSLAFIEGVAIGGASAGAGYARHQLLVRAAPGTIGRGTSSTVGGLGGFRYAATNGALRQATPALGTTAAMDIYVTTGLINYTFGVREFD